MTTHTRNKVTTKNRTFKIWRLKRRGQDYKCYTKSRNQVKWACCKAKQEFERKLSKECKQNPAFFKYTKSKLKTKPGIAQLLTEDGTLIKSDTQKANILNRYGLDPQKTLLHEIV